MARRWIAATDGSSLGNPGPAGWAWAVAKDARLFVHSWDSGRLGVATSNAAELQALLQLLRHVPASRPLEVRLDSKYVLHAAGSKPRVNRAGDLVRKDGQPLKHAGEIRAIHEELRDRDVRLVWVRAHQPRSVGDPLNYFVDRAARGAAASMSPREVSR